VSYDLRLTVPEESEIEGLGLEEVLALFFFGKADETTVRPPIIIGDKGGKMKPVFFWISAGSPLSRPINTVGTIASAAKYTTIPVGKMIVWEGSFAAGAYTVETPGRYFILAAAQGNVASSSTVGDFLVGLNDTTILGLGIVMRDISDWGAGGTTFDIVDLVVGDRIAFYSANTSAGAASWTAYKIHMLLMRLE